MSQEPVKIVVVVSGGMVQSVGTFGVPVTVVIMDYDCEDSPEDCITNVPTMCAVGSDVIGPGDAVMVEWMATPLTPAEVSFLEGEGF